MAADTRFLRIKPMTKKVSTSELKVGDAFLTKGGNLNSSFDKTLMAICTAILPNGIGWRSFSPTYGHAGGSMKIRGYQRESNYHFEVEYVGVKDTINNEIWLSLVELSPLFFDKNNKLHKNG